MSCVCRYEMLSWTVLTKTAQNSEKQLFFNCHQPRRHLIVPRFGIIHQLRIFKLLKDQKCLYKHSFVPEDAPMHIWLALKLCYFIPYPFSDKNKIHFHTSARSPKDISPHTIKGNFTSHRVKFFVPFLDPWAKWNTKKFRDIFRLLFSVLAR